MRKRYKPYIITTVMVAKGMFWVFLIRSLSNKKLLFFKFSLSLYYLNATSKSYKEANLELKKKLQSVRIENYWFFVFY